MSSTGSPGETERQSEKEMSINEAGATDKGAEKETTSDTKGILSPSGETDERTKTGATPNREGITNPSGGKRKGTAMNKEGNTDSSRTSQVDDDAMNVDDDSVSAIPLVVIPSKKRARNSEPDDTDRGTVQLSSSMSTDVITRDSETASGNNARWVKNSVRVIVCDENLKTENRELQEGIAILENKLSRYQHLDHSLVQDIDLSTASEREKDLIALINKICPQPVDSSFEPSNENEAALWNTVKDLEEKNVALSCINESLLEANRLLSVEYRATESSSSSDEKITVLLTRNHNLNERVKLSDQVKSLREKLEQALGTGNQNSASGSNRLQRIDDVEKEQRQIQNLENANRELSIQVADLAPKLQAEQSICAELKQQLVDLKAIHTKEMQDLQDRLEDAIDDGTVSASNDLQTAFEDLRTAQSEKAKRCLQWKEEVERYKKQYQELEVKNSEDHAELKTIREEKIALEAERDKTKADVDILEKKLQNLEAASSSEKADLNSDLETLKVTCEQNHGRLVEERSNAEEKCRQLENDVNRYKKGITDLETVCANNARDLEDLRNKKAGLEHELQRLVNSKTACEQNHGRLTDEKSEAEASFFAGEMPST
ncbi:hypothetical protein VKT23_019408 [Stygiomarasmius scandens]|uniref:Uncharacterized protein n=1 Tax=Marasmiellus scandens TaxID=2682957 RepID=A0ABR1IPQ4_9AGAR